MAHYHWKELFPPTSGREGLNATINDASKDEEERTKEQVVNLFSEQQICGLLVQFARNDSYIWEKIQLAAINRLPQMQKRQW